MTFEENLIEELDQTPEAKAKGRSAVLRRLAEEYIRKVRAEEIASRYRSAYEDGGRDAGKALGDGFDGWEEQGQWPRE